MGDNPVTTEVEKFDKKCLKKTETKEKNTLPTQAEIEEEKKCAQEQK
ncbi:thymosin beta 1 [Pempheris klunzingeri]